MTRESPLIVVVEDEPQLRRLLRSTLESNGYRCIEAESARQALLDAANHRPDLLLLDLGLPDRDGLDVIRAVREWSALPIIVLSARSREDDKIAALDAGADDYVTKPFNAGELLARVRVALRHAATRGLADTQGRFQVGELRVDRVRRQVFVRDVEVHLTPIEYRLLGALIQHAGQVVTHTQLLREVWGPGKVEQHHYLRTFMAELRRKLELDPSRPIYLLTEVGVGYRLADE